MNKILLIEDEEELRELIAYNLEKGGYEVIALDNANDALIILDDNQISAILLDLMLPGLKGMQFLSILKSSADKRSIPVIIISAKNAERDVVTALESGADDYLTKPFSMQILLARLGALLRRTEQHDSAVLRFGPIAVNTETYRVMVDDKEVKLTNKEFELLCLLMKNSRKVFTRNQLLNTIWGYDTESFTRTVDSHVSTLRKKLGDAGRVIKSIPKIGYGLEN